MAHGRVSALAVEAAQDEWAGFHLAVADVHQHLPERLMEKMGKIYRGRPLAVKSRKELLATIKPQHWKYLREDNGDLPDGWEAAKRSAPSLNILRSGS